jgi:hypothetical protein
MALSREQYDFLVSAMARSRVSKDPKGNAHVEAWDIRRHLIRFFGFGGWDFTVVVCDLVKEIEHEPRRRKGKDGVEFGEAFRPWTVVYRVIGRLTVRDPDGNHLCVYEDGATGDAANQPSLGDAHDMALKTAMSQALKRCAVNLGDQFGLSLYNNGSIEATVARSLVAPPKEGDDDGTGDSDGGGAEPGPAGEGPGPDGTGAGVSRPGGDHEAGGVRPGVQPGVPRRGGFGGAAQAPRDRRGAPAEVGG